MHIWPSWEMEQYHTPLIQHVQYIEYNINQLNYETMFEKYFWELKIKHPDMGIAILGDFNRTEIKPICRAHALSQVVNKPTRENAILDLIMTNVKHFYDDPSVSSPVGSSDHVTIYWSPKHGYRIESRLVCKKIN